MWLCGYGVLGLLAPVHRCARSVRGVACTVSWASWLLFTAVHALRVVLCVRCPGPPGSCSPVCTLCVRCCVYGVLGILAPVHRCARSVCGVVCTVPWASWLLFTAVHALCVVSRVRRPEPPGSCSPVCTLCARVRCPGPPGSRSPVCTLCVWWCVYGVLGLLAPVHRCARSVCGVVCTFSWASWLLFTGVHALCVVLRVPFGPFVLVCSCGVWCVVRVVSWDTWFVFSGVAVCCGVCGVRCAVLRVRCPRPSGPCSPVRTPGLWCCVGGVLGRLAPVHRCACAVFCVVCALSWATWLLFTGVPAWRVLCRVFGVLGPVVPFHRRAVCLVGVLCGVCGVPGHVIPVHRCASLVCCVVCAVWVWVRDRVRHTGAATLRTLCFCLNIFLYTWLPMASYLFFPSWTL